MDLQLYRIDDQNYLVDFRNLGYRSIKPSPAASTPGAPSSIGGSPSLSQSSISIPASELASPVNPIAASLPNTADELRTRQPDLPPSAQSSRKTKATGQEVSSPYLFLECAVRLIVELASPAGGDAA